MTPVMNQAGCWYFIYARACVLCGRTDTHRTRMLPPAPPKADRYAYSEYACDSHFL